MKIYIFYGHLSEFSECFTNVVPVEKIKNKKEINSKFKSLNPDYLFYIKKSTACRETTVKTIKNYSIFFKKLGLISNKKKYGTFTQIYLMKDSEKIVRDLSIWLNNIRGKKDKKRKWLMFSHYKNYLIMHTSYFNIPINSLFLYYAKYPLSNLYKNNITDKDKIIKETLKKIPIRLRYGGEKIAFWTAFGYYLYSKDFHSVTSEFNNPNGIASSLEFSIMNSRDSAGELENFLNKYKISETQNLESSVYNNNNSDGIKGDLQRILKFWEKKELNY